MRAELGSVKLSFLRMIWIFAENPKAQTHLLAVLDQSFNHNDSVAENLTIGHMIAEG
jgi:hypothetical protein